MPAVKPRDQAIFFRRRHQPSRPPLAKNQTGRRPVLASIVNRSSFLMANLNSSDNPRRKLSETVVVHGNAPHDRPRFLVSRLIGNRAGFLCTKAPMLRVVPDKRYGWHRLVGVSFHQHGFLSSIVNCS
jgi:hypothetical protein